MKKEGLIDRIETEINSLQSESTLSFDEVLRILKKRNEDKKTKTIPVSVFNRKISSLETIVKYLKENHNLSYKEIAFLLNRNYAPIAITYRNSIKKYSSKLKEKHSEKIPISIFSNKKLSVLENIIVYLKETLGLSYRKISVMIQRDERTIWTCYNRAIKKMKQIRVKK